MKTNRIAYAVSAALLLTAQGGFISVAQANGPSGASVDELRRIIEQQQRQLDAQARTLEALRQQVENVEKTQAEAEVAFPTVPPRQVASGLDEVKLSLSGQVNRGVLVTDDGEESDIFHVDNDNSSTRVRFIGEVSPTEDFTVGTQIEVQFESNSTADVNQKNKRNVGPNSFTERKLEVFFDSKKLGRLWIGQGDTASNGTSEEDLSGTGVVGYSGIADMAGGILFRNSDTGELTDISIGDVFSNFDGLSRDDRLRYDTPNRGGFIASASAIADDRWDIALRHGADFGPVKTTAAIAYADPQSNSVDYRLNGSFSLLHDSGFNFTAAAGQDSLDNGGNDPQFWYIKLGYQKEFFSVGNTAFAIDYTEADDIDQQDDKFKTYGLFAVQKLDDYGTEIYLGLRNHELDRADTPTDDIFAALAGARVKF